MTYNRTFKQTTNKQTPEQNYYFKKIDIDGLIDMKMQKARQISRKISRYLDRQVDIQKDRQISRRTGRYVERQQIRKRQVDMQNDRY